MLYEQLSWNFDDSPSKEQSSPSKALEKDHLGQSKVYYKKFSSILTKASGFMNAFDYTLNPYSGCTFGCTYCYAAFFSRTEEMRNQWGYWVQVKENALTLLKKFRDKPLTGKTVYMSSVTDPYQPIEKDLEITRAILEELINYHQPYLVIQTRSPLVARDIDLLKNFEKLQVNMTVTTDDEKVRKAFEPHCSSTSARLSAIKKVTNAGIKTCITMTPLLPIADARSFAETLLETKVEKFVVQPFHPDRGKFVAGTRENALNVIEEMGWSLSKYQEVLEVIKTYIPQIGEGKKGFSEL